MEVSSNYLSQKETNTTQNCQQACQEDSKCGAWTFRRQYSLCYKYSEATYATSNFADPVVSGPKNC
jgi:hypothetical protein